MSKILLPKPASESLSVYEAIRNIVQSAKNNIYQAVNSVMVETYWNIGKCIIEEEQQGKERAEYGKKLIEHLADKLTTEFGRGYNPRNLRNMRAFYQTFPIWNALRAELSWTHYRCLIRIANPTTRTWYMKEAIEQNWSARALERQIAVLYYERLLSSKESIPVENEAKEKTNELAIESKDYLRDPYIFDFLNISSQPILESDLEQGLINNLQKFLLELGKGFAFVERQKRISTEDQDFLR